MNTHKCITTQIRSTVQSKSAVSTSWVHCGWPLRNSKVFHSMNSVMERCNDLMELVHTIHDFRFVSGSLCTPYKILYIVSLVQWSR